MPLETYILFLPLGPATTARTLKDKPGSNTHYIITFAYEAAKFADRQKI